MAAPSTNTDSTTTYAYYSCLYHHLHFCYYSSSTSNTRLRCISAFEHFSYKAASHMHSIPKTANNLPLPNHTILGWSELCWKYLWTFLPFLPYPDTQANQECWFCQSLPLQRAKARPVCLIQRLPLAFWAWNTKMGSKKDVESQKLQNRKQTKNIVVWFGWSDIGSRVSIRVAKVSWGPGQNAQLWLQV